MEASFRRFDDGRIMSSMYTRGSETVFYLSEPIENGVLVTEFNSDSEVLNQTYIDGKDPAHELAKLLGVVHFKVEDYGKYPGVMIHSACKKCESAGLHRELDGMEPHKIREVPVVPIFLCGKCGEKHYSLTDSYLKRLVKENRHFFDEKEREEIDRDERESIKTLHEYIIRIFASKKIHRIEKK